MSTDHVSEKWIGLLISKHIDLTTTNMPSILARLTKLYIGYKFSAVRNATPELSYETIFTQAEAQDIVDPVPADIAGSDQFTLVERREKLPAGQEWVVHHLSLNEGYQGEQRGKGKEQVLIYWHGGAFRHKVSRCDLCL